MYIHLILSLPVLISPQKILISPETTLSPLFHRPDLKGVKIFLKKSKKAILSLFTMSESEAWMPGQPQPRSPDQPSSYCTGTLVLPTNCVPLSATVAKSDPLIGPLFPQVTSVIFFRNPLKWQPGGNKVRVREASCCMCRIILEFLGTPEPAHFHTGPQPGCEQTVTAGRWGLNTNVP